MENIKIERFLDRDAFSLFYQIFNERNGCHWTQEQFKQSLRNQPYLHFLVFKKESEIVGIINPWNNKMYDIEYAKDDTITNYMKSYQKEIMGA